MRPGTAHYAELDRYATAAPGLPMAGPEQVVVRGRADLAPVAAVRRASSMTWTHAENAVTAHSDLAANLQVVALGGA